MRIAPWLVVLLVLCSTSVYAGGIDMSSAFQGEGKVLLEIIVICFVSMVLAIIAKSMGYGNIAGLITFIAVMVIIIKTTDLFDLMLSKLSQFVIGR